MWITRVNGKDWWGSYIICNGERSIMDFIASIIQCIAPRHIEVRNDEIWNMLIVGTKSQQ